MPVILFLLLALSPHFIFTYNIDTSHPTIYEDPEPGGADNSFGFTVSLSWNRNSNPASSLFVGAPKYSNGVGKVYRCTETSPGISSCRGLVINPQSAPKTIPIRKLGLSQVIVYPGNSGGLGASMAIGESSNLTVCAPYSVIKSQSQSSYHLDDMRGYCYNVPNGLGDFLYRENDILVDEGRYPLNQKINNIYGFSVHYAVNKNSRTVYRVIGQPRLDNVEIKQGLKTKLMPFQLEERNNLGYSVSSGYFFDPKELIFVAGSPGWMRTGRVLLIVTEYIMQISTIKGSVLGEYFGASLATGDFDGDGLDDIAIGAPHWGEVNFGRVYTFYGNSDRSLTRGLQLQGQAEYGQFGYTLASADLDNDRYTDLIVSAPWEDSGVVYIYYGSSDFRSKGSSVRITQRITPSEIMPRMKVERFGFALSDPVDIDENGYPDLAIGAYKSGHAIVLRSRPVIKTEVSLSSYPGILPNTTESFVVSVCVKYRGIRAPNSQALEFEMTVDEDHKRVEGGPLKVFSDVFYIDRLHCTNKTLTLMKWNRNFVDTIMIRVKHRVKETGPDGRFCPSCPVLSKKDFRESMEMGVPFNTGCKNGVICNAKLYLTARFGGTREDDEWVVGSGDISLNLILENKGEPAYQTQLIIDIPAGIHLRNAIPSCIEVKRDDAMTLVCQAGDPLSEGETKNLDIGLDMGRIVESVGGTLLTFNVTKRTRSIDGGTESRIMLYLKIKNVAYVTLTSLADQESHDYGRAENKSMVPIRHTYRVIKRGETPIRRARLTIDVPIAIAGRNISSLNISELKFTDGAGRVSECSIDDANNPIQDFNSMESNPISLERRRRETSDDYDELAESTTLSMTEDAREVDDEETNDIHETRVNVDAQNTDRTIYLNCSTKDVTCVKITCRFSLSKTSDDVGNVALDLVVDANAFYTSIEDSLTVKFNTNASVKILSPYISDPTYIRNTTAGASTMIYNIPEPQKLSGWIIPSSIIFGILLFCILAFILFRVGFFNRPKKAVTAKAKEKEMILKTGGAEEDECKE